MKVNDEKYKSFIKEQKEYFENNLKKGFNGKWEDTSWYGGAIGSGWLSSRSGKSHFSFGTINKRLIGLDDLIIDQTYQDFIKSILILSYRKSNSIASPQKLYAEFLILKRWYSALYTEDKEKTHPCYLSSIVLDNSFKILANSSNIMNLPDHAGTYHRIKDMINYYSFTEDNLEFDLKYLYPNSQNRTSKAKKTKELIDQFELDENDLDKEKLISIRTFINIVSLIGLCKSNGEKIVLNFLLLLIITGLRSTEAILIKTDALIKKPIIDPVTKEHLTLDNVKQYTFGIQYHGAKGAGFRIHWVEPSTSNLVKIIFHSVLELTKEYRQHVQYIRSKNCRDLLPKVIDDIPDKFVEINDLIGTVFGTNDNNRSRAAQRTAIGYTLKNVPIYKSFRIGAEVKKYYLKEDINSFVKPLTNSYSEFPIDHVFNYEGKTEKISYEDLLFLHEYRSTNLKRELSNKTNVIPLNVIQVNSFLGNSENKSVFEKYNLLESENSYSKLTTHIPRHNINTFLALSGLAEHLQAMLMGRIDIKQNQYYQHLALKQRRVAASILEKHELMLFDDEYELKSHSPIDAIKNDGLMFFSKEHDLENNLKMNLQTFNSKKEVASYIKNSFFDEYFEDIAQSFNELVEDNPSTTDSLVKRHAYLHPLPIGGCMRDISVHDCPKRLACQSGDQCGNFALTGRKGELEALKSQLKKLLDEYDEIMLLISNNASYIEMLEHLLQKIKFLSYLQEKALTRQNSLTPIPVFPYSDELNRLPTTLSELFAIEQQKIESKVI